MNIVKLALTTGISLLCLGIISGCPKDEQAPPISQPPARVTPPAGKEAAEEPATESATPEESAAESTPAAGGEFTEQEPNDHYQSPNKVSELVIVGSISSKEDKDQFELTGQQGTRPTFTLEHGPDVNFDFKVYSNTERVDGSKSMQSPDILTCEVPGTCLVMINSLRGTGDYKLTITSGNSTAPAKVRIDENAGKSSEQEPNDFNHPTAFSGDTIYGQIESPTDEDWYSVSIPAEAEKTFAIYHDPSNDFDFEIHTDTGILATVMSAETGDSRKVKVPAAFRVKVWKGKGTGWYRIEIK